MAKGPSPARASSRFVESAAWNRCYCERGTRSAAVLRSVAEVPGREIGLLRESLRLTNSGDGFSALIRNYAALLSASILRSQLVNRFQLAPVWSTNSLAAARSLLAPPVVSQIGVAFGSPGSARLPSGPPTFAGPFRTHG